MPTPLPDFQSGDKTTHTNKEFQCSAFAVMPGGCAEHGKQRGGEAFRAGTSEVRRASEAAFGR